MFKRIAGLLCFSLAAALLWSCEKEESALAPNTSSVQEGLKQVNMDMYDKLESFDGSTIPAGWQVSGNGTLALSPKHYKMGNQSLHWSWSGESVIRVENSHMQTAAKSKTGGMTVWIYNEKAADEKLTFNLGSKLELEQNNPKYTFEFGLDFTGWRALWIRFGEDAANKLYTGDKQSVPEMMELTAPALEQGALYFDGVEFSENVLWHRSADYQFPDLRRTSLKNKNLYYSYKNPDLPSTKPIDKKDEEAFATIMSRYEKWVFGDRGQLDSSSEPIQIRTAALQKFIRSGLSKYEELGIKRDADGVITGKPLFGMNSPQKPNFGNDVANEIFMPLVFDYKLNENEESKQKLFELFDFYHDQGWAEGSALGSLYLELLRYSGYFHAVGLMREELQQSGRLERELAAINWYSEIGGIFEEERAEITADDLRTLFMYKLLYVLCMEDSSRKVQYMNQLVEWMNRSLSIAPGFSGTIKPDFTGFHHRGVYANAYAPNGYHIASIVLYLLHDTVFSLSEDAVGNLKNALLTQRLLSNPYDVPIGTAGRFPHSTAITHSLTPAFAYMAVAQKSVDKEMAAAFMRLWDPESTFFKQQLFPKAKTEISYVDTLGGLQIMLELAQRGYKAEQNPVGFWVKPYAALGVHRRGDWMVAAKGWSQYVWDFEGSARENVYGRYSSYGSIQILANGEPVNAADSGYGLANGWDWNRWPGTTAKYIPLEELKYKEGATLHRSFTDETFVGGVSSEGSNGLFSMKLHDTVYDKSFRAHKSVFFFGNEIIALGSDIVNNDENHPTETTLFQSYLPTDEVPFWLNSPDAQTEFPYKAEISETGPVWLTDPKGNGYVLPDGKGLHVVRGTQTSKDQTGAKTTTGSYVTAWLDHGFKPAGEGYEYVILVQSSPEQVEAYARKPSYKVLQKDNRAHIVEHSQYDTTGYAIFDPQLDISHGYVRKVSVPSMVMVNRQKGKIVVSVADPDLRLPKTPDMRMDEETALIGSVMQTMEVELEGEWKLTKPSDLARVVAYEGNRTKLAFDAIDGRTMEVDLVEKQ